MISDVCVVVFHFSLELNVVRMSLHVIHGAIRASCMQGVCLRTNVSTACIADVQCRNGLHTSLYHPIFVGHPHMASLIYSQMMGKYMTSLQKDLLFGTRKSCTSCRARRFGFADETLHVACISCCFLRLLMKTVRSQTVEGQCFQYCY